jgi:hypothetical protein
MEHYRTPGRPRIERAQLTLYTESRSVLVGPTAEDPANRRQTTRLHLVDRATGARYSWTDPAAAGVPLDTTIQVSATVSYIESHRRHILRFVRIHTDLAAIRAERIEELERRDAATTAAALKREAAKQKRLEESAARLDDERMPVRRTPTADAIDERGALLLEEERRAASARRHLARSNAAARKLDRALRDIGT